MIKVEKQKAPAFLQSQIVDLASEKMDEFYSSTNRSQKRYDFPFNKGIDKDLRKFLYEEFHGKCGYCEIKLDSPDAGIVDRYRPYDGVRDKNEYFQDLYWWLTFEWSNLVYCCKECNQYKASYFPVKGKRATSKSNVIVMEKALLLHPCFDDVESHFSLHSGEIMSQTDEGYQTIALLNLNRKSLVDARLAALYEIDGIINKIARGIENVNPSDLDYLNRIFDKDPRVEFLFAKHEHLLEEIDQNRFILKYINDTDDYEPRSSSKIRVRRLKKSNSKLIKSDYFPIEYIQINNFKSIESLKIDFKDDGVDNNSWVTILGENGLGKSSILQAFCIAASPQLQNGDSQIADLIKDNEDTAEISIKQRDSDNVIVTRLIRKDNRIEHSGHFFSPLIGYGSTRLLATPALAQEKVREQISYQNLFNPLVPLSDVFSWLNSIYLDNKNMFNIIAYSLRLLLPQDVDDDLVIIKNELAFKKSKRYYNSLSDGYKSTIALALDIMKKLSDGKTDINKLFGIVLIDELGNQLHPRWQMQVVKQLRKVFPKVTFIVSTHHPLCLRGLEEGEIVLLNKNKEIFSVQELPNPKAMRVDQILASEFFGLHSLIDPQLEAEFNRYYFLLAKEKKLTQIEKNELMELRNELRDKQQFGSSLREELMYSVIDNLLAKKLLYNQGALKKEELKSEAIQKTMEVWKRLNINIDDQS